MADQEEIAASLSWGVVDPAAWERVVVVQPHFDDAVQGAGHVLITYPGATVVTVFGGPPPSYPPEPTTWDALGGFRAGDDVVARRREEDLAALDVVSARARWLEFADHQYLEPEARATADEVAPELIAALADLEPTSVFLPMGLANPDHVVTHDAGLLARQALGTGPGPDDADRGAGGVAWRCWWFCYEDHGYKHIPGMLAWRVATLFKAGLWPTPAIVPVVVDAERKRRALYEYRSQIPPLEQDHALRARLQGNVPEQYWLLDLPPAGWEALATLVFGTEG